jgi:hypothetical protein
VNAASRALDSEFWRILKVLDNTIPDLKSMREAKRNVRRELERALRGIRDPVLYLIDNVPETSPGEHVRSIEHFCPALGAVTVLATSRQDTREAGVQTIPVVSENSVRVGNAEVMIFVEIMLASTMNAVFVACFALLTSTFQNRAELHAEILALRHQLAVLQRNAPRRLCLTRFDRLLWILLARFWSSWRSSLQIVQPATVLRWQRRAFRWYWARKSRRVPGRPAVGREIRDLIRHMSQANPLWGAPRIHGELLKLGIEVAQSTVAKYLQPSRRPCGYRKLRPI